METLDNYKLTELDKIRSEIRNTKLVSQSKVIAIENILGTNAITSVKRIQCFTGLESEHGYKDVLNVLDSILDTSVGLESASVYNQDENTLFIMSKLIKDCLVIKDHKTRIERNNVSNVNDLLKNAFKVDFEGIYLSLENSTGVIRNKELTCSEFFSLLSGLVLKDKNFIYKLFNFNSIGNTEHLKDDVDGIYNEFLKHKDKEIESPYQVVENEYNVGLTHEDCVRYRKIDRKLLLLTLESLFPERLLEFKSYRGSDAPITMEVANFLISKLPIVVDVLNITYLYLLELLTSIRKTGTFNGLSLSGILKDKTSAYLYHYSGDATGLNQMSNNVNNIVSLLNDLISNENYLRASLELRLTTGQIKGYEVDYRSHLVASIHELISSLSNYISNDPEISKIAIEDRLYKYHNEALIKYFKYTVDGIKNVSDYRYLLRLLSVL